jgi:hypothetical protein
MNWIPTKNVWGQLLLAEVFFLTFIASWFPESWNSTLYAVMFTLLYFTAVMNLDSGRPAMFRAVIVLFLLTWLARFMEMELLQAISFTLDVLFFIYLVYRLVSQIARAVEVDERVIVEAINGYLFLGLIFSVMVRLILLFSPSAFAFADGRPVLFHDYIYFSFVTFATLGYGDLLPMTPLAKSLAILTTISGQLYLAILVALLVGKYANRKRPGP